MSLAHISCTHVSGTEVLSIATKQPVEPNLARLLLVWLEKFQALKYMQSCMTWSSCRANAKETCDNPAINHRNRPQHQNRQPGWVLASTNHYNIVAPFVTMSSFLCLCNNTQSTPTHSLSQCPAAMYRMCTSIAQHLASTTSCKHQNLGSTGRDGDLLTVGMHLLCRQSDLHSWQQLWYWQWQLRPRQWCWKWWHNWCWWGSPKLLAMQPIHVIHILMLLAAT